MKFENKGDRDAAVRMLKEGGFQEGGQKIWAKPDEMLKVRVIKDLVFDTKNLLIGWSWDKRGIWAESGMVWMGNDMVLEGVTDGKALKVNYGTKWEEYLNDSVHPRFMELLASLKAKLATANSVCKGLGKGNDKGKGKIHSKAAGSCK